MTIPTQEFEKENHFSAIEQKLHKQRKKREKLKLNQLQNLQNAHEILKELAWEEEEEFFSKFFKTTSKEIEKILSSKLLQNKRKKINSDKKTEEFVITSTFQKASTFSVNISSDEEMNSFSDIDSEFTYSDTFSKIVSKIPQNPWKKVEKSKNQKQKKNTQI